MNVAVIVGLCVAGVVLFAAVIALVLRLADDRAERNRRIARQQVVMHADQALHESTLATLHAMNDAVKRAYRQ